MHVLVAVDSFKGSLGSVYVAAAIAAGWRSVRPDDVVVELPLADGGEGTADVVEAAVDGAVRHTVPGVSGPDGDHVDGEWIELPDGTAVVDLAQMSGIPRMAELAPMTATTWGLGETIRAAVDAGASRVWIGLGGSASTDGGVGALQALGLQALDTRGEPISVGGKGLIHLACVDATELVPIDGGVTLLTDVTSPLTGERGAAAVFGPQKGATPEQVQDLDEGLRRLAGVLGHDPATPGAGAAGGTGYGFAAVYGAQIVSGADHIAELTQLDARIADADLVITGEGAFDQQSLQGKLVGNVLTRAHTAATASAVIAGVIREDPRVPCASLVEVAGDVDSALAEPARWAAEAAATLARSWAD